MKEQYTAEMAHAAVARGAAWLDEKCPEWVREINLSKLNLQLPGVCILGQTADCIVGKGSSDYDGYWRVIRARDESPTAQDRWAVHHGFLWPLGHGRVATEMLTIAWKELIRQRLEAAVS